jgi:CubicO group peptidase (beta-lactamase class C family)
MRSNPNCSSPQALAGRKGWPSSTHGQGNKIVHRRHRWTVPFSHSWEATMTAPTKIGDNIQKLSDSARFSAKGLHPLLSNAGSLSGIQAENHRPCGQNFMLILKHYLLLLFPKSHNPTYLPSCRSRAAANGTLFPPPAADDLSAATERSGDHLSSRFRAGKFVMVAFFAATAAVPLAAEPGIPPSPEGSHVAHVDMDPLLNVFDALAPKPPESAEVVPLRSDGLLDDFDDGNDVGWNRYSIASVAPTWEVVNGRYRVSLGPPAWMQSVEYALTQWNDSVVHPDTYRHGRVRMRLSFAHPETDVFLLVRGQTPAFGVQFWKGQPRLTIGNLFNMTTASLPAFADVPIALSIGSDYYLEARFVGADLSLKFWLASDPEPATPQLVTQDPRWWQSTARGGRIELFVLDWWRTGAIGVEFDEIYFFSEPGPAPPVFSPGAIPVRGVPVPCLAAFDHVMRNRMAAANVAAGTLAVMRNGVVVYERGFGWQDVQRTQILRHDAPMRLASVTKPFTAAAIRTLIDSGAISLTSRAFNVGQSGGGILAITPFPSLGDARIGDITVNHLLQHRGGWNRNLVGDFDYSDYAAAEAMGLPMPISGVDRMRFILGRPLQFTPGTQTAYANIGYDVLGLIVEEVTGLSFMQYLQDNVLDPLGVSPDDFMPGRTNWEEHNPREPFYDALFESPSVFDPLGPWVQQPYGDWHHELKVSFGGLISAARPVLGLLDERIVWGPDIGLPRSPNEPTNYKAAHLGGMPGTATVAAQRGDGVNFVVLFNNILPGNPANDVYNDLTAILDAGVVTWPALPAGDFDCDVDADDDDFAFMANCMSGPGAAVSGNCDYAGMDEDGDVDMMDFLALQFAFTDHQP